ncbi:MAG TPA: hypothetical protein DCM40_20220, partial [Maribacter sp.]|nr:hypothetical protein [Maribacter sp.]
GGIVDFYLQNSEYSALKSKVWDTITVTGSKTYMARVTLRRSMTGSRNYSKEYGSTNVGFSNNPYGKIGGQLLVTASAGTPFDFINNDTAGFPLPQDPMRYTGSAF